ncbi:c-type cytochrome biogenesis protein CcmI [uncultured Litoreibacter sp.]|uniref:c-type cytochrome biogenesis protein CcmI n=1 Tax=uncultured Litoreibacter sp. TaxID=1392394 RepID=UPI002603915F|nr:c-type cytochrome biogenesis protein CcmI [uncultured Litoreibacter sp.]
MIWVVAALMALSVGVALLWPLGSGGAPRQGRAAKAMAIYEDQLSELDRDAERGLITPEESRAAQVEIKRRMLGVGDTFEATGSTSGRMAIVAAALFVPVAAFGLYTQVGAPGIPAVPFAERQNEVQNANQLNTLIAELVSRLENDPAGGETRGWELLATTYMNQGRPAEAAAAFERVIDRDDATSATFSQYAEALITAERGTVTPLASRMITRSMELDPSNPAATFYRAIELEQAGQGAQARTLLLDRIAQESQAQPWMPTFLQTANQMGATLGEAAVELPDFAAPRGPTQEDIEAASELSAEDRQAFILNMVDGLEERLQDEPENLDGWLQLARALVVLGQEDRAVKALRSAKPLVVDLPEDDQRRRLVEEGLKRFEGGN